MTDEQKKSIQDKIRNAIDHGEIRPRPKWYFSLRAALLICGIIISAALLIFLSSFAIFVLHENGAWFLPGLGPRGFARFVSALPWLVIAAAVVFFALLEKLLRQYQFAYKRPILYSLAAVIILAGGASAFVASLHLHESLLERARAHRLPFGEQFYRYFGEAPAPHVTPGILVEKTPAGWRIRTRRGQVLTVTTTPRTMFAPGVSLSQGDMIVVIGDREDDTITASGVRELPDDGMFMAPPQGGHPPPR